jgi:hypothetical protein
MPGSPSTAPAPDLPPGPRHALVVATTADTDPSYHDAAIRVWT